MEATRTETAAPVQRAAFSVDEFCTAHTITKPLFYKLLKAGRGPKIMKCGTRTLISIEAAADWRRQMEADAVLMPSRRSKH